MKVQPFGSNCPRFKYENNVNESKIAEDENFAMEKNVSDQIKVLTPKKAQVI